MLEIEIREPDGSSRVLSCHRIVVDKSHGMTFICHGPGIGEHNEIILPLVIDFKQIINIPEA